MISYFNINLRDKCGEVIDAKQYGTSHIIFKVKLIQRKFYYKKFARSSIPFLADQKFISWSFLMENWIFALKHH